MRAARFEVVDAADRVRAVFGFLGSAPDIGDIYGVSLLDPTGAERAALTLDEHGPALVLLQAGNIAVHIGVDDAVLPGDHSGAFITVADRDGGPRLRLWIAADGSLQLEPTP